MSNSLLHSSQGERDARRAVDARGDVPGLRALLPEAAAGRLQVTTLTGVMRVPILPLFP